MAKYSGWAKFGVRNLNDNFSSLLDLANEFKQEAVELSHDRHVQEICLRNTYFPALWNSLRDREYAKVGVWRAKQELAKHDMLIGAAKKAVKELKMQGASCRRAKDREGMEAVRNEAEMADKSLQEAKANKEAAIKILNIAESRCSQIAVDWEPLKASQAKMKSDRESRKAELKRLGIVGPNDKRRHDVPVPQYTDGTYENAVTAMFEKFYSDQKELSARYQKLGLHSTIRAEILDAIADMTFTCDPLKPGDIAPHSSLSVQIKAKSGHSAPTFDELMAGSYGLAIQYVGSGTGKNNDCHLYHIRQDVGTRDVPRVAEYDMLLHRPIPANASMQRWTLVLGEKPYVTVMIGKTVVACESKTSYVTNDYSTGRQVAGGGLLVCHFLGEHINEPVYLPGWLVEKFQRVDELDEMLAESAGDLLKSLGLSERDHKITTIRNSSSQFSECADWLSRFDRTWNARNKMLKQARGCRDAIFHTVAARVSKLHTHLIEDPIDLAELKRNKTRDRRRDHDLSDRNRRNFQIAAPGELRRILRETNLDRSIKITTEHSSRTCPNCGHVNAESAKTKLIECEMCRGFWDRDSEGACVEHLARGGVDHGKLLVARNTDVITTYIASLGQKTGPKSYYHQDPSWIRAATVAA